MMLDARCTVEMSRSLEENYIYDNLLTFVDPFLFVWYNIVDGSAELLLILLLRPRRSLYEYKSDLYHTLNIFVVFMICMA